MPPAVRVNVAAGDATDASASSSDAPT